VSQRAGRERDFAERAGWDPDYVRRPPGLGAYITIYVLGDELELLNQLGITPQHCVVAAEYLDTG
jgi:hypothetical protein